MLRWLGNALASSVGKKLVMGLTGLLLLGFLAEHLYGNVKLLPVFAHGATDGSAFEEYRHHLHEWRPYLYVAEIGLFALFACHAYLGLRLSMENMAARKSRYVSRNDRGAKTFGSSSMFVTGALVLAYLIKHVLDFRLSAEYDEAPGATVAQVLGSPLHGLLYIAAMIVLGVHLSHGFQSAFQSLGANHPRWTPILKLAGYAIAIAVALGFASIPVYFLTQGGQ